nr:hypothetical protein [Tanacetum cinerariifolium]
MAFRPYQLVQTKSIILHPGEVPKQQPDVCFPVNNDQSISIELSLGFSVLGSTSSITEQSSLPMMKGLSPSKHMELVNVLGIDPSTIIIHLIASQELMAPQDISPTYKDVLATQVNRPMKKRKERPKRIEFGQKLLYMSDLRKSQNRLNMPINQLETKDFLTNEEKTNLESGTEIVVPLLGPTLRMYAKPMKLNIWLMGRTNNYVLMNKWNNFMEENKDYLKQLSTIQLWLFRVNQQLCFALAVVESPKANGVNEVA